MSEDVTEAWVPSDVDTSVPSTARGYDYLLGGAHNFEVDRKLAEATEQAMPGIRDVARLNRAFLRRAVTFLVSQGVRQFLDIGSGIPTAGNVHEIAQDLDPECRVVYVDKEAVAVAHSEMLLAGNPRAAMIRSDLRDIDGIVGHPDARRLLDPDQPTALLMLLLLHFVPDEWGPKSIITEYLSRLGPGSYLTVSHAAQGDEMNAVAKVVRATRDNVYPRTHQEVTDLFAGLDLVEPGLVGCGLWRPEGAGDMSNDSDANAKVYVGVARTR